MTTTLAVDELNDLFIGDDGALALKSDLQATLQACAHAAKTQLAEMIYAVDDGIPNFAIVWNGSPNKSQFEAYMRRTLLAVENVIEVPELSTVIANHVLSYQATIKTIFGIGVING